MKLKHSKFKNTGVLFELLVRQITSDTLSNKNTKALDIIKKFFNKTELSKEHKLYQSLLEYKNSNQVKAESAINSILELSKKINVSLLNDEKYNLVKTIRENYNIDEFFKSKINNYKNMASIYLLIEAFRSNDLVEPGLVVNAKHTLLEYITNKPIDKNQVEDRVLEEFIKSDKETRLLTYKLLLESFNKKYTILSVSQKAILKEYINNVDNTENLKTFYNKHVPTVKRKLTRLIKTVDDPSTKIKLEEIVSLLKAIPNEHSVKDNNILNLLQYHEIINELESIKNES